MAAHYGDNLTPFFIAQSQPYFQINNALSDHLFTWLGDDPAFGDHNRPWLRAWTDKWLSKTVEAMRDFIGIYAKVDKIQASAMPASIKATVRRVLDDWTEDYANGIDFKIDPDQLIASIARDVK